MAERGRKSVAALSTATIHAVHRPEVPERLSGEEADVWRLTVGRLPSEWFLGETLPLLEMYCIHVCHHRRYSQMLRKHGVPQEDFIRISQFAKEQAEIVIRIATKLRITLQSTHDKRKSRNQNKPQVFKKPWEKNEED